MRRLLFTGTLITLSVAFGLAKYHYDHNNYVDESPLPEDGMSLISAVMAQSCIETIGYYNDFDTSEAYMSPACWTLYNAGLPFDAGMNVSSYPPSEISTPNYLDLNAAGTDTVMAITPMFSDLTSGNKMVSFFAASSSRSEKVIIGTVDSDVPPLNFSPLDTFFLNLNYKEFVVNITSANYNGTGKHIAFMHGNEEAWSSVKIDNFLYDTLPVCPKTINPTITHIGDTSIVVTLDGEGTSFDFFWGPPGYDQGTATHATGGNPFTIHPLNPNSEYEFQLATNCTGQSNGISDYTIRYSFKTQCSPTSSPYYSGFDNDVPGEAANCWTNVLRGNGNNEVSVHQQGASSPFSPPYMLRMYKSDNTASTDLTMTASPYFTDLDEDEHQVRFVASSVRGDNAILIGTVTSPLYPETFVLQDSIFLLSSGQDNRNPVYAEYISALDTSLIPADHHHIAFIKSNNTDPFSSLYIDNFYYEPENDCKGPDITSMQVITKDKSSARISWSGGQVTDTRIYYGVSGFKENAQTYDSLSVSSASANLTALSSNTNYDVYARSLCPGGGSYWIGPLTFITECSTLMAPFFEDFDGPTWAPGKDYQNEDDYFDNCWSRDPINSGIYGWSVGTGLTPVSGTGPNSDVGGAGNYLFTHSGLGSEFDTAKVMTPLIDISNLSSPYMDFYFHRYGTNMTDLHVEYRSVTSGWLPLMRIEVEPQVQASSPYSKIGMLLPDTISVIQIRFRTVSPGFGGADIAIDEISVNEAPSCAMITDVEVATLSDTSATFTWGSTGPGQQYEVWFGEAGFYLGNATPDTARIIVNTNSFTVDTLTANTDYQILVRAICALGDTSDLSFAFNTTTLCAPYGMPYFTDFNSDMDGETPYCWDVIERGPSAQAHTFHTTDAYSEPACLYMNSGFNANVIMSVSPAFADLPTGTGRLRMKVKRSNIAKEVLYVGTISRPFADTNFHPIDTIYLSSNYSTYIQDFTAEEGYNGTDINIAFKHGNTSSGQLVDREIFIDDLHFEVIPSCPEPHSLETDTSYISDSTAVVRWEDNGSSSYIIEYGFGGFTPGTGSMITTSDDSVVIHLQKVNRPYDFYVRSICGPDTSMPFGPSNFYTPPALCDGFEQYSPGLLKEQSSLFKPDQFGFEFDVTEVTTSKSYSGNQSVYLYPNPMYGYSSAIADFEDLDSGAYIFSIAVNVTSQHTGNYVVYQDLTTSGTGFQVTFKEETAGIFDVQGNITDTVAKFSYTPDQWIYIQHIIDLDNDTTWMLVDGVDINTGWKYTFDHPNTETRIERIAFSAVASFFGTVDDYYIDDFCIQPYNNCPASLIDSLTAQGCDEVVVTLIDTTSTLIEYGIKGFELGSGQQVNSSPTRVNTISGLESGTTYQFYSYSICNGTDTSLVNGPFSITTDSLPAPSIQISSSKSITASDQTVSMDASNSVNTDYVVWDYGDGVRDTGMTSSRTFTSNKELRVIATAYSECGTSSDTIYFDINIGMEENRMDSRLHIYPNPFSEEVTIRLERPESSELELRVANAQGQLIMYKKIEDIGAEFNQTFPMQNFAPGMYILIIETDQYSYRKYLNKM